MNDMEVYRVSGCAVFRLGPTPEQAVTVTNVYNAETTASNNNSHLVSNYLIIVSA